MMNWISRTLGVTGVCVRTSVVGGEPVAAQQSPSPAADKNAVVLIPGVLTGPGTMGPRGFIPNPIDQNPWAHWRSPMDMMRQG